MTPTVSLAHAKSGSDNELEAHLLRLNDDNFKHSPPRAVSLRWLHEYFNLGN
jgi:hypothetical protein